MVAKRRSLAQATVNPKRIVVEQKVTDRCCLNGVTQASPESLAGAVDSSLKEESIFNLFSLLTATSQMRNLLIISVR